MAKRGVRARVGSTTTTEAVFGGVVVVKSVQNAAR